MLGVISFPILGKKYYTVCGGPYRQIPKGYVGVKMAAEISFQRRGVEISIPTVDFNVPDEEELADGLTSAVQHLIKGKKMYVGCMGGKGRTGLFLSVLARAFGIENPVEYVRANYYPHAVETKDQYQYVMEFEIPRKVKLMIKWAKFKSLFAFKNCLTEQ